MRQNLKAALLATSLMLMPASSIADTADGEALNGMAWDEIVEMAKGGEVNWFLWGGSDNINQYVTEFVGGILKDEYDITLNRVGLSDTVEAVNIVLGEKESGVMDAGSVDMIWINGENFRTMKAQFAFAYDTARTENPPRSIGELIEWVKANPGRFTYPAPPDFNGSVFVRHVFYHAAGGVDNLLGDFDQAKFDEVSAKIWEILNDLEPYLWREGATYPASISAMEQLYANSAGDWGGAAAQAVLCRARRRCKRRCPMSGAPSPPSRSGAHPRRYRPSSTPSKCIRMWPPPKSWPRRPCLSFRPPGFQQLKRAGSKTWASNISPKPRGITSRGLPLS